MSVKANLHEFIDQENLHFEMEAGVRNLNTVTEALGYKADGFANGSSLERFLEDNSGAMDAILEWIGEQHSEEWEANLESNLNELEEEDPDAAANEKAYGQRDSHGLADFEDRLAEETMTSLVHGSSPNFYDILTKNMYESRETD